MTTSEIEITQQGTDAAMDLVLLTYVMAPMLARTMGMEPLRICHVTVKALKNSIQQRLMDEKGARERAQYKRKADEAFAKEVAERRERAKELHVRTKGIMEAIAQGVHGENTQRNQRGQRALPAANMSVEYV